MTRFLATALLLAAPIFSGGVFAQTVTTPEQAFGFKLGTDRKLADWKELTPYYQKLASESDRIKYTEIGKTTEGRPFVMLTISSPDNLAHADETKAALAKLADSRITSPAQAKEIIANTRPVLVITCNIHSTEIASSQSCAQFAYRLVTDNSPKFEDIRKNVIIVMVPSINPDGQQLVVDWYKKYLGTPYEGCSPVVLWTHYTGHDDNRDWYAFTQIESQLAVDKVINPWHPQVLYDLHQMGALGPRLFIPPWVDPIDPNIDPLLIASTNAVGSNLALEVSETGKTGVLINGVYDMWSPARAYMAYHGSLRILTESASVNIASPIDTPFSTLDKGIGYDAKVAKWNFPNPWKGGEWHLGDIVAYQLDALASLAGQMSTYRERFLNDFYTINKDTTEQREGGPYAYVIPYEQVDQAATVRMINIFRRGEVEVERATAGFDADGKHYSAGSYIVVLAQPYGGFAKTLLEPQHYPDILEYPGGPPQRPYDVTAQTLPMLLGVDVVPVTAKFTATTTPVTTAAVAPGLVEGVGKVKGYLLDDTANNDYYALFALLKDNVTAYRLTGSTLPKGTIYIPNRPGVTAKVEAVAAKFAVNFKGTPQPIDGPALEVKLPRIALYQSWLPSMDEGWTRWIFDMNGIPYTRVVDADIRKDDLNAKFDVLLIPDEAASAVLRGSFGRRGGGGEGGPQVPPEFRGGMGDIGFANVTNFLHKGGTVVALNNASTVFTQQGSTDVNDVLNGVPPKQFYIPGSILEVNVDTSNPIGFGSKPTVPVFFESGPTFKAEGPVKSVAGYTNPHPLLSGWIMGGKYLDGQSALVEKPIGEGRIVLFGFRPQYRGQSEVTYKMMFNALLYSTEKPVTKLVAAKDAASSRLQERQ
jgi:hypothetical protein